MERAFVSLGQIPHDPLPGPVELSYPWYYRGGSKFAGHEIPFDHAANIRVILDRQRIEWIETMGVYTMRYRRSKDIQV